METVFYITFYRTNGPGHHAAFYVDQLSAPWKTIEKYLANRAEELGEQYGEPDWSSDQNPNSFGCICYNVGNEMHETLLELWRQTFFEAWPTCVVGPVCAVDAHTIRLTDMLQITKTAYEQQQAQQLRDTLNTHVNEGSLAPHKKM